MGKFYVLLSAVAFFSFTCLNAQVTVTIGTASNVNSTFGWPSPYGHYSWSSKHQILIRASELTAAGMVPCFITDLGFNVSSVSSGGGTCGGVTPLTDYEIKLKLTSITQVSTSSFETGLSTVWGPSNFTETAGWNLHTFPSNFYWDGTSNLLIQTCHQRSCYANKTP